MTGDLAALVPAAGRGERLGGAGPKAFRLLLGEPLLRHVVRGLRAAPMPGLIVVAAPPGQEQGAWESLGDLADGVAVVAGGASRQASVAAALGALPDGVDVVLVHDAARPLVPAGLVRAVVAAVRDGADAAVPGLAVTDTVKSVDAAGWVVRTLARDTLRAVQTPQAFRRAALASAHERARRAGGPESTDDAALVEADGGRVRVVPGDPRAIKVTTPADLRVAQALLAGDDHGC